MVAYDSEVNSIAEKWKFEELGAFNNCIPISQHLGYLIRKNNKSAVVFTAFSKNLDRTSIIFADKHQVTVVYQNSKWVAVDAAITGYNNKNEKSVEFHADSKNGLLSKLSLFYTGNWFLNKVYNDKESVFTNIETREKESVVRFGMLPSHVKFRIRNSVDFNNDEEGVSHLESILE